jgi:hypothetical protein
MPADLAAVQADDALLDFLGGGGTPSEASDDLTHVLAAWRREVHAEPVRELVDTNTALAVIRAAAARQPVRRHNPVFGSIAAAAAVLVIAFAGVGLVAKQAQPGDQLWGVTQVLYSDYARSVETAAAVRTELNEARTALQENKPEKARASLQRVRQQLPVIGETEGRTDLTARHRELEQRILNGGARSAGSSTWPAFPAPPASSTRPEATSPKPSEPPTSSESTTTPNPTTEPPHSSTSPTSPKEIPPGPDRDNSDVSPSSMGPPPPHTRDPRDGGRPGEGSMPDGSSQGGRGFSGADHPRPSVPPVCDRPGPRPPHCDG